MRFAKLVFTGAGIWGIAVLVPLYFLFDLSGRKYAPPATYPHFFYGFLSVTLAWQIAFLLIGSDPVKLRPLMIPSLIEKAGYVLTVAVLYAQGQISSTDASTALPDMLLASLFVIAFAKTRTDDLSGDARTLR
jgi:hypothetical protein